ncbi:ROK family transcriptional regulator [Agrobacterium sp. fls2-241-TYG-188a]|uniref:ROK family transcriptional regulator n=1 Tax=Agrobacterium sp. fls2-241-TYG-188a TaxID=3040275 RepID=UPI000DDDAE10|nr:ROK family transcriptional regulator [Agrobacterium sp. fls2-241-TYG-188a]
MLTSSRRPFDGIGNTQAAVLRYLRRKQSASRAEIAELCGVTPAAVSMMTRDLIERGIVLEGAKRQVGRGAPQIDLSLNPSIGFALGVHANRFSITLSLLDFGGIMVGELHLPGRYDTFAEVQNEIRNGKDRLLAQGGVGNNQLIGAGIAMPTRFRHGNAFLDLAQEVISWAGPDLTASLQAGLGCTVVIENDANAAAMGELTVGNAAAHQNFVYLYLSEGIGSGIIIGRQLYRGSLGNAGEVGALRARGLSRPSFEDLADWCASRSAKVPADRSPDAWKHYLDTNGDVLGDWLKRAGPEIARLAFPVSAVLAPQAIYVGGTLPLMVREQLLPWLNFSVSDPFEGARVLQPEILLPEVSATDAVAFGAAAMILHDLPGRT